MGDVSAAIARTLADRQREKSSPAHQEQLERRANAGRLFTAGIMALGVGGTGESGGEAPRWLSVPAFERFHVSEIFRASGGPLVLEQRLAPNHRDADARHVDIDRVPHGLVEAHAVDRGEDLDEHGLAPHAVAVAFSCKQILGDAVLIERGAESTQCREDTLSVGRRSANEDIQVVGCSSVPVHRHRPSAYQDELCLGFDELVEQIDVVLG